MLRDRQLCVCVFSYMSVCVCVCVFFLCVCVCVCVLRIGVEHQLADYSLPTSRNSNAKAAKATGTLSAQQKKYQLHTRECYMENHKAEISQIPAMSDFTQLPPTDSRE